MLGKFFHAKDVSIFEKKIVCLFTLCWKLNKLALELYKKIYLTNALINIFIQILDYTGTA